MEDVFRLRGTVIDGKYRVDAAIGEGGFGVVYGGWDTWASITRSQ